ncbi:MAG TPA: PIN domain-containing protein [Opitutaceae bacterium]|jgi:predicted nucleic acid-binding protein|nr:PIN domain-containing protein [Opitutaceae bacterium]
MRVVVDTSFWIDYSRGAISPEERERVETLWRLGSCVLYQLVWLELVVGYRSPREQRVLRDYRAICRWEPLSAEDGAKAEALADLLRRKGRTIGASDLLVMAAADRLGAKLIHHDDDFDQALGLTEFAHLALTD